LFTLFINLCSLFSAPSCKDGYCPDIYTPYLAFANENNENAVGEEILYLAIDSLLYFSLIMLMEFGVLGILYDKIKKEHIGNGVIKQLLDAVMHEQNRVLGQVGGKYTPLLLSACCNSCISICKEFDYNEEGKPNFVYKNTKEPR
jgi:hypothetical protein